MGIFNGHLSCCYVRSSLPVSVETFISGLVFPFLVMTEADRLRFVVSAYRVVCICFRQFILD